MSIAKCPRSWTFEKNFSKCYKQLSFTQKFSSNCYYEKIGNEKIDITEELDFELPCGWEYIRLKTITTLTGGFTPKPEELSTIGSIPYYKVSDMNTPENHKYMVKGTQYYISEVSRKTFPKNSIIFPKNGGAVLTNKKRILTQESVVDLNTGVLIPYQPIDIEYLFILFSTIDFNKHHKGSSLPTINTDFMSNIVFGLPPLAEQKRIVFQVQTIMQYIDLLEKNQVEYSSLIETLKKAILQSAIQGKLVSQDENDESASVLLERIRAEKKAQLGKKYVESYIFKGDDNRYYEKIGTKEPILLENLPFEIPSTWSWARLSEVITLLSGRDLEPTQYNSNNQGVPYITGASNFYNGNLTINRWTEAPAVIPQINDLLITCKGTIGETAYNPYEKIHIARQVMAIHSDYLWLKYIEIFLKAYITELQTKARSFIPGISRNDILELLIPIPPYDEQVRICERIKQIFESIKDEG